MYRREWHLMTVERDTLRDVRDRTCASLARLTSELAAAREDEARVDFFEKHVRSAHTMSDGTVWVSIGKQMFDGPMWRDAIDAARSAGGE